MRRTFPGFGFVLGSAAALWGCGGATGNMKVASAEAASPPAPIAEMAAAPSVADAPPPGAPPPGAPPPGALPAPPAANAPAETSRTKLAGQEPVGAALAPSREMLDIEGNISVQVPKVKRAVQALHELAARVGGVVTEERVNTASEYGTAQLTLRVPSGSAQGVFDALDGIGSVLEQNVTARDIGKEYFDANLRLSSLETTLHRYEEILTHANKVEEILSIEQELARIRAEMEQVKGNLRWLSDRAARATLHIALREQQPEIVRTEQPEAKFFPGLRLPGLLDFGQAPTSGYLGGGFSLQFSRALSLDLDVLAHPGSNDRAPDAVLASIGGELYSDLLGRGERRYLNPYLGWRAGYARFQKDNQALVGATLGLELYKVRGFGLDLEARNYLAFGGSRGSHYLLAPALTARVAF